jgi:tetratricopeptide (TPR) repeat protein
MRSRLLICLLLAAAIVAVYWQVGGFGFTNLDDDEYVTDNAAVRAGLAWHGALWALTARYASNWHPLTWISHMLDCQLFGLSPTGHHLVNLLFHMANTILLFLLLTRMTGCLWRSAFVAALFGLHPLHVESVAWVAERKDVLSTLFWMLTMWAYLHYAQSPKPTRYLLVVLAFTLGLMAKPMLVTLAFVLLLLDWWPLGRLAREKGGQGDHARSWRKLVWEKIPLFVLAAASSAVTYIVQQRSGAVGSFELYPLGVRVANAIVAYVNYIAKMFWPAHLAVFYPHPGAALPTWQVVGSGLALVLITVLAIRARRRPYLAVGWLWYILTLVPVIGLVQVGNQAMADRYTYVPLVGVFIIIAWGVPELLALRTTEVHRRRLLAAPAGIVIAALAVCTYSQVGYWHDDVALFGHALKVTSNNALVHNNLGVALAAQGAAEKAVEHYSEALRIEPDYPEAHNNLGTALAKRGRTDEAIAHFTAALRVRPSFAEAHGNLGVALAMQGRIDDAIVHFSAALKANPESADAHYNLGKCFVALGRTREAITQYQQALRFKPGHPQAANSLAWIYATSENPEFRDGAEAVRLATQACQNTAFRDPLILDTLAAAYAEAGRFSEAVTTARKSLALVSSAGQSELADRIRARLRLYDTRRPFHYGQDGRAKQ